MAKRRRMLRVFLWILGSFVVIVLVSGGALFFFLPDPVSIARTFDPECQDSDEACKLWAAFRANHPYPFQGFAGGQLPGGRVLMVVSEPPADISHDAATTFLATLFADRSPRLTRRRWPTGADGYVEDVLVEFIAPEMTGDDAMQVPDLRDRIALLSLAWYGTTYGADLEPIKRTRLKRTGATAPNLSIKSGELHAWLTDTTLTWLAVDSDNDGASPWTALADAGAAGAFRSVDGMLVLLTFPSALVGDPARLQTLKADFRRFAVASDATLGAVWTGRQIAFIGRARTHALAELPPLRFETFALLAAQRADALHQSYERNNAMAGKLINEGLVDWAPIYLSDVLRDTEFGSLLNITDQMLKSWSQYGQIDYLYFNYPLRPDKFPFDKPLTVKVHELQKTDKTSVLFNWNTAGSAAVLEQPGQKFLTVHSLGALPVTYGSERTAGEMTTGKDLAGFEEAAYSYFASLGDPNLARVVQYTLMYQTFRAISADGNNVRTPPPPAHTSTPAAQVLIDATRGVLGKLEAGVLQPDDDAGVDKAAFAKEMETARAQLKELRSHQPDMTLDRLAIRLADPRRVDPIAAAEEQRLFAEAKTLEALRTQFEADATAFNAFVTALRAEVEAYARQHNDAQAEARFKPRLADLKRQKAELDRRNSEFEQRIAQIKKFEANRTEVHAFGSMLQEIVMASQNLSLVRQRFEKANEREVAGWIRTPSYVVSQDSRDVRSVGGHNVDARALRLVPDRSTSDMRFVETPAGRELHYNPDKIDMAEHATEVSRAVEHGNADVPTLLQIVATKEAPRERIVALAMQSPDQGRQWAARIGSKRFATNSDFVGELRTIKTKTPCCRVLAKDANDAFYLAETNTKPPPTATVTSFGDTASLTLYMARHGGEGDVITLGQPIEHVEAVFAGLTVDPVAPSRFDTLAAAARRLFGRPRSEPADHIMLVDLRGRPGGVDPPGVGGGPAEERVGPIVKLAGKRAEAARVEPLTRGDAAKIVGGVEWTAAADGAPEVTRVRFGDGSSLDTIAGFHAGESGANLRSLNQAVSTSAELANAKPGSRMVVLAATIKNELKQLSKDQLGRVLFVVHEEGGAKTQFTHAPTLARVPG